MAGVPWFKKFGFQSASNSPSESRIGCGTNFVREFSPPPRLACNYSDQVPGTVSSVSLPDVTTFLSAESFSVIPRVMSKR